MTANCIECGSIVDANNNCPNCGPVLPVFTKAPKSLNYKERNAGKFRTLSTKTGLKPFSKKQRKKLQAYANSESMQDCEGCVKCGTYSSLQKHHVYGRSAIINGVQSIELWIWLCHDCHEWVHANSNEAMKLGYLQPEYRNQKLIGERVMPWKSGDK